MKLIYHKNNVSGNISPFDEALLKVSNNANPLYLASPYIGLNYLNRIIDNANDWKLLSDVEAWLSSGSRRNRANCWQFIVHNINRIKHVPDLHAKVAIGNNLLLLGSANFTDKGVLGRDELSILIDDSDTVNESLDWFNSIWNSASSPVINEGDELVKALDALMWTAPSSKVKLSSSAVTVKSILSTSARPDGFDVASSFAKSSLNESFKLLPTEEAFKNISDEWFEQNRSFTFKELLEAASNYQPLVTNNELWSLITRETVNHWLGGLFIDGFDRYVYENGLFVKWGAKKLASVTNIDNMLKFIINKIKLSPQKSYLPFEDDWLDVGVPEHNILTIVEYLISVGLLIEIDKPGEIEMYSLDDKYEWPKRWNKFARAFGAYTNKQTLIIQTPKSRSDYYDEFDDEFDGSFVETSEYIHSLKATREVKRISKSEIKSASDEIDNTADQLGISIGKLINIREEYLISFFTEALQKGNDLAVRDIERAYEKHISKNFPKKFKSTFRGYRNGPFVTKIQSKSNTSIAKPSDIALLNKLWTADHYLQLYPEALRHWKEFLK